jgi:MFS family permease
VAFIEEFRWSRAETSIAYAVSQLVAGASSPLVGTLVDRRGPCRLLLLGGSLLVLGLPASAFISALWQIIVLYGNVMTIGANCLGLVVFVPLLSRHFADAAVWRSRSSNRPTALGAPPGVGPTADRTFGWRGTHLA